MPVRHRGPGMGLILLLLFASGAVSLIYEVLWMKQLGLLFGNTARAAAATLTAFFAGLGAGAYLFGRRAASLDNPLRGYGWLELTVALTAAGYFLLLDAYHAVYPVLFEHFADHGAVFVAVKFALALMILFPPALAIGGTLPLLSQYLVRRTDLLGRRVSLLYAVNTLGAALGALLAGFYLPHLLGFKNSYWLAIALNTGIGLLALAMARHVRMPRCRETDATALPAADRLTEQLAFTSGFITLALQVLWTRMLAQVLQNSVYTFAAILVVFLLCLAAGAGVANRAMRLRFPTDRWLGWSLGAGGLATAATPFAFMAWTDGMHYIGAQQGWPAYLLSVLGFAVGLMGVPLLCLGMVFPLLLKRGEGSAPGRVVGRLTGLNTLGAICGSLLAGFVLLEALGLWSSIRLIGMLCLLLALRLCSRVGGRNSGAGLIMLGILALVSVLDVSRLPVVRVDPVVEQESLLESWESSAGTVAVIRRRDEIKLKVDNYYTLGGSGSKELEALEGRLPLALHPAPASVYVLGLGTGISAGAVLEAPVRRLLVTELMADVATAADRYFGDYTNGLFYDPRARVVVEDGRNFLAGSRETFDVIIADLFIPWKAGAGNLYTLEHFRSVRQRLNPHGLFMQWLPAYQLSPGDFLSIARTLAEVFPQLTLWRGNYSARRPVLGLLGQAEPGPAAAAGRWPLDPGDAADAARLTRYAGHFRKTDPLLAAAPLNRDDRPLIEYRAPVAQRAEKAGTARWLTDSALIDLQQQLRGAPDDPFLARFPRELRELAGAGFYRQRAQAHRQAGRLQAADADIERYRERVAAWRAVRDNSAAAGP